MKVTSTIYPQLVVHDLDITFVDGEAETSDKATIDALRGLPPEMGVRMASGRPPKAAIDA